MGEMRSRGWWIHLAAAMLLPAASAAGTPTPADQPVIEAVWKPQSINFVYNGYSTLYSCSGLEQKLKKILRSVGARDGIELRAYSCADGDATARFQIVLTSPVEATAENVAALTTYDTRDQLAARVRGERLPNAEDVRRFPAVRKTISFARSREMRLAPGDCELVRALRRQILPRMSVEVLSDHLQCSAFGNVGKPQLVVSALVPAEGTKVVD